MDDIRQAVQPGQRGKVRRLVCRTRLNQLLDMSATFFRRVMRDDPKPDAIAFAFGKNEVNCAGWLLTLAELGDACHFQ